MNLFLVTILYRMCVMYLFGTFLRPSRRKQILPPRSEKRTQDERAGIVRYECPVVLCTWYGLFEGKRDLGPVSRAELVHSCVGKLRPVQYAQAV